MGSPRKEHSSRWPHVKDRSKGFLSETGCACTECHKRCPEPIWTVRRVQGGGKECRNRWAGPLGKTRSRKAPPWWCVALQVSSGATEVRSLPSRTQHTLPETWFTCQALVRGETWREQTNISFCMISLPPLHTHRHTQSLTLCLNEKLEIFQRAFLILSVVV